MTVHVIREYVLIEVKCFSSVPGTGKTFRYVIKVSFHNTGIILLLFNK